MNSEWQDFERGFNQRDEAYELGREEWDLFLRAREERQQERLSEPCSCCFGRAHTLMNGRCQSCHEQWRAERGAA